MSNSKVEPRAFRNALGSFATGITVITANHGTGPVGMTANSFNSVSLEPPLVLWSIAKSSLSRSVFQDAEYWGVNVLSDTQVDISNRFAKAGTAKFDFPGWYLDEHSIPMLDGTCVSFLCKRYAVHEGGDHLILVGEVVKFQTTEKRPILYHAGHYATLQPLAA